MATAFGHGGQSPTSISRTLEKVFDDAQYSGEINLSGRKLKDYPKISTKYDLADTSTTDISKNRYSEIPPEVCHYTSMDRLMCYNNIIRIIPEAIVQLQALTNLHLSRNQLTNIPPFICQLQSLEVLLASNNKLVSLPEEIGRLDKLMDLDVSCNEINHLPSQLGDMESLKRLNVRRNLLVELPEEISKLKLRLLDFSGNKISKIPAPYRKMDTLEDLVLDHNPLVSPPAHVCTRGRIHIIKYLEMEAVKEDRKRGIMSDTDMRRYFRKSTSLQSSHSDDFTRYNGEAPIEIRRKRHTVDSGYSTTDSSEKSRWSPSEVGVATDAREAQVIRDLDDVSTLALKAGETVKEHRQEREAGLQKRIAHEVASASLRSQTPPPPPPPQPPLAPPLEAAQYSPPPPPPEAPYPIESPETLPKSESEMNLEDEFTRELQRQKSEYEAKKKMAEKIRRDLEEEEEREQRRRAALKLQEEQKVLLDRQREETRRKSETSYSPPTQPTAQPNYSNYNDPTTVSPSPSPNRRQQPPPSTLQTSQSFREEKNGYPNNNYRRTASDSGKLFYQEQQRQQQEQQHQVAPPVVADSEERWRNNGTPETPPSVESNHTSHSSQQVAPPPQQQQQQQPAMTNHSSSRPQEEFLSRHEALASQTRHEAQMLRRRLEEEKNRMRDYQKKALYDFMSRRAGTVRGIGGMEEDGYQYARDGIPHNSYNSPPPPPPSSQSTPPPHHHHPYNRTPPLQQQANAPPGYSSFNNGDDLNNLQPGFTMRRHMNHIREELDQIEQLRFNIESRLKVKLPDDLTSALKDGVVLCHLANHIRPRSVSSIHVPSPAVPKLTTAKCRRNVENFLEAVRRIGVDQEQVCVPADIIEENGLLPIAITVQALVDYSSTRQSTV